jgi:hypothetical protein
VLFLFLRRLFVVALASTCAVGCGGDEGGSPPSELVSPPEWNIAAALVHDGNSLYVARAVRLDRIDATSGIVSEVAGPEWAECPGHPAITWMPTVMDWGYPNLVVRGTTLYMVEGRCGLWSFDVVTKQKRMLVDPTSETKGRAPVPGSRMRSVVPSRRDVRARDASTS